MVGSCGTNPFNLIRIRRSIHGLSPLLQQRLLIRQRIEGAAGNSRHGSRGLNLRVITQGRHRTERKSSQDQCMEPHRDHQARLAD